MRRIVAPTSFRLVSSLFLTAGLAGCVVGPSPYEEYTLARSAVRAAQEIDSAQFAVGLWTKSEENFRLGEQAWKDNENDAARKYFKMAQVYAERAENATRLKKFQSGDAMP
jgi:hypothetical protein